jgi:hypothetical protein
MNSDDFDRDPALTLKLRALHRPPADPAYWDGLEARIMEHVRADGSADQRKLSTSGGFAAIGGWWEPFAQWRRIGAATAAAALALTAWGFWDTTVRDDRLAYEAAVEALASPLDSAGVPMNEVQSEKTVPDLFRY